MGDDVRQLERQLERATAADLPPGEPLDAETAALRETWLAWTRLLEAAHPDGDVVRAVRCPVRRPARGRWQTWMAAAAAVSISAVLATTGLVAPQRGGGIGGTASHPTSTGGGSGTRVSAGTPSELAWDDTLDDQIASAGRELILVKRGWSDFDRPLDAMYQRLQQIEKDIGEDTL